jgi:hypothetical protein
VKFGRQSEIGGENLVEEVKSKSNKVKLKKEKMEFSSRSEINVDKKLEEVKLKH